MGIYWKKDQLKLEFFRYFSWTDRMITNIFFYFNNRRWCKLTKIQTIIKNTSQTLWQDTIHRHYCLFSLYQSLFSLYYNKSMFFSSVKCIITKFIFLLISTTHESFNWQQKKNVWLSLSTGCIVDFYILFSQREALFCARLG